MVRTYKKKIFSVIVTLAMIFSLLGGMALPATVSAEPGSYGVTISATNATFSVTGQSTPPYYSDANGVIEITVEGSGAYVYPVVKVTSGNAKTVCVTRTAANTYTISNVEDVTDVEIYGCVDISTSGSYNITGGGYYYIGAGVTTARTITVSTTSPVHLKGGVIDKDTLGSANTNTSITCVAGAQLGIEDIFIASPNSGGNVINFTGAGNKLFIHGTSILESTGFGNGAVIHVGLTNATVLAIGGYNKCAALYIYKSSGSAAIGGNSGESCGELTFESGNIFIKGSQVGAVIGGDSGSTTNDDITIKGGCLNIVAVARGAAIGGSNQTGGGNVYLEGGNVAITCDFTGPAIGHGQSGSAHGGGTLYIDGGSLLIMLTKNSTDSGMTPAAAINATIRDSSNNDLIPLVYTPDDPDTIATIGVGTNPTFYVGPVNPYVYSPSSVTTENWVNVPPKSNSSLYLYVPDSTMSVDIDTCATDISDVTFDFDVATAKLFTDRYQPVETVFMADTRQFNVVTIGDYSVTDVDVDGADYLDDGDDYYTLYNASAGTTVTITAEIGHPVTFSVNDATVYVNDLDVTSDTLTIAESTGEITFYVLPDEGYKIGTVTTDKGMLTNHNDGSYTLSAVGGDAEITVPTAVDNTAWYKLADTDWYTLGTDPYEIETAEDLAGLAELVNNGNTFACKTITLLDDIVLAGAEWTPIGILNSKAFKGTFDGAGHTVSGLSVTRVTPHTGGYGLFGYVDGGTIQNLTVSGAVVTAADADNVGGIVGYLEGSIYNCHNTATVTVNNGGSSGVGGVAGTVANLTSPAASYVQLCSNSGVITGYSSLGGVVGSAECAATGGVLIDQCFNTGTVSCVGTSSGVAYVGGIVGYNMGKIQNSYNRGNINNGQVHEPDEIYHRYYMGGISGLLNGADSIYASITGCYNSGNFTYDDGNFDPGQNDEFPNAQPLWARDDGSPLITVTNCIYLDDSTQSSLGATETNVCSISDGDLRSGAAISGTRLSSTYFTQIGYDYPTLLWEGMADNLRGPIYLDGTAGSNGSGTAASPFNSLSSALGAQSIYRSTIYITGEVTVDFEETIDMTTAKARIVRGNGYSGLLFEVVSAGDLTMTSGIIDGSTANTAIKVNGGAFTIAPSGKLKIGEVVYLASENYIMLDADLTSDLTVDTQDEPAEGIVLVATASTEQIAINSIERFHYNAAGIAFFRDVTDIYAEEE